MCFTSWPNFGVKMLCLERKYDFVAYFMENVATTRVIHYKCKTYADKPLQIPICTFRRKKVTETETPLMKLLIHEAKAKPQNHKIFGRRLSLLHVARISKFDKLHVSS